MDVIKIEGLFSTSDLITKAVALVGFGVFSMLDSVFDNISLRELYGNRFRNQTCAKIIPAFAVEYFECRSPQAFRLHSTLETNSPPFAGDYSPTLPDLILLAQEDGLVHLYNTSVSGPQAFIRDYEPHANAVFDVKWLASGTSFLTASGDQSIRLVDAERGISLQQFFGHTMSVRCLSLMPSDTQIFASASRDGSIRIWDIRLKSDTVNFRGTPGTSSVGLLSQCHLPDWSAQATVENPITRRPRTPRRQLTDAQSVTSVLFKNENTLLSAGSTDGSIKMWDLRRIFSIASKKKAKPKFILPYRGVSQKRSGYSDLQLNSVHSRLYANCLDNVVYEYDLLRNSTSPVFAYTGHQTDSFYIKLDVSPDDRYVICGSSDRRAHIYAIGQRRQCPIVLSGHNGEVSVPRWCRSDPTRIVTLSDDSRAFVWNMFPARRCILPQPGELAGLAERLSPSEGLMSPGEQDRRIVRSPRSTPSRSTQQAVASALATTTSPSAASARRRQSNINCFLSALSPPCSSPQQGTKQGPTVPPAGCIGQLGRRNAATLTETLGGVVQRFPGLCVASTTTSGNSTPPLGCYSPTANVRSPSTPVSAHHRRLLSPDRLYSDASDIENISPSISRQPLLRDNLPLDCVDGPLGLTRSPILCCSTNTHMVPSTPETPPPTSLVKRTPLGLHQALFNTPPPPQQLLDENSHSVVVPRKRPSMFLDSAPEVRDPDRMLLGKRRRLTVYEPIDRRAGAPVSHSPTTPIGRRRRMTTCTTRALTPITKFFKRNGDDKI